MMNVEGNIWQVQQKGAPFQWGALPLRSCTDTLKLLGSALLNHLLVCGLAPAASVWDNLASVKGGHASVFPGIASFELSAKPSGLSQQLGALLLESPILAWHRWRLRPSSRSRSMAAHWRPLLQHCRSRLLSGQGRGRLVTLLAARRFFGDCPFLLPNALWRVAGKLAFEQPSYQYQASRKIVAYLRSRMVMIPQELPPITLSAQTFWLLIALFRPTKPPLIKRLMPRWRKRQKLIEALAVVAQKQSTTTSWAGLWDQWLLLHALHQNPKALVLLDDPLRRGLACLPLLAGSNLLCDQRAAISTGNSLGVLSLASPVCREIDPRWFSQLYESTLWEVSPRV